ncbi:uncharacterized protein LOC127705665 [Mytilus californianus]|uniref:uncharacterized protein LOC127705665 n=1 Tax=Mytilus californianus TaxID=6549 RepID=UPI0022482941|nr:uncharacterized protein LOC127705665 [Mytilus californianus]
MMILRLSLLIISTIICLCYREFHCPSPSEWKIRANWYCNGITTSRYTCLYNVFNQKYEEACKHEPDLLDLGEEYIISHLPRGEKCKNENKYQPFKLDINVSSECVLRKSLCNEEGQVLFYNGSSKEDRSCRCDFTNSYAFVVRPQHQCKCLPAMEDCSCYVKKCLPNFKLTSEYMCIHRDNKTFISSCPDMIYASSHRKDTALQYQFRISEKETDNIEDMCKEL